MAVLSPLLTAMMALSHSASTQFRAPAESDIQIGTIMSWPTAESTMDDTSPDPNSQVRDTRQEIADIAKAVAKHQAVEMFVRDPELGEPARDIPDTNLETAREMLGSVKNVTLHVTQNVHSLWARDTGPVFVRSLNGTVKNTWGASDDPGLGFERKNTSGEVVGLLLNYNNWGRKTLPNTDSWFAAYASQALNKSSRTAPFIAEGGGIEVDGEGTLLASESSILNPNRNPGVDKPTMERYFAEFLGIEKTIWIPGFRGGDITDDHIDSIARFAAPGTVLLSKAFDNGEDGALDDYYDIKDILSKATDAKGRKLRVIDVPEPDPVKVLGEDYTPELGTVSYVNYLVVNGAVIVAKFGDDEFDREAARIIGEQHPGRVVEHVRLHQLATQGGGIHCATQQIPA
ncbi:hypothetical protein M409DRAFT_16705 [Zasmidium cellare ATCC 36951]|uniref:Agmatine deiminase n=1 Tax=Zasmidium cellare ATCC 36951 TaxID=1080233 RepID=A0A6A6D3H8_ZASCE|nr:uncharacterized protein M409DRAFT_16705 [Zasmidium cellare ATCC 36951]KAF2172742.1 hypothetical protein M409DRAFT_16705 [Zasmidium cellare ATCC 36951]